MPTLNHGRPDEVVWSWRRCCRPLQCVRKPWIIAGQRSVASTPQNIGQKNNTGQPTKNKYREESAYKNQRCFESGTARPYRGDPAEDLNAAWNRNHDTGRGKKTLSQLRQACSEHVMHP